jgi:regulator of replication initiation timing
MTFELLFQGKSFPVPRKSVWEFLDHRRDLLDAKTYKVESLVSVEVFEKFVDSLKNQTKILVTKENVESLSLLAKEFCFEELRSECLNLDSVPNLSERVSKLERQISSLSIRQFLEQIESQERGLESLRLEVEQLKKLLALPKAQAANTPEPALSVKQSTPNSPKSTPSLSPRPEKKLDFPLKEPNSREGIISYLTKVHERGTVTITSTSVDGKYAPKNVADLTARSCFKSKDWPGEWICWDFHEMRVCPTHYTINAWLLKSWAVEGSLDGENWTEIDRQTDNQDFRKWNAVSFTVSDPVESRFIRLIQTDKRPGGNGHLFLGAVEFFGTLSE